MDDARKHLLLEDLVKELRAERGYAEPIQGSNNELWDEFRALVNTRPPSNSNDALLAKQNELLQGMIAEIGICNLDDAHACPYDARLKLWRGDITAFAADAIVNAANSRLLGCWIPGHYCIDNAIHTFAGVQLRLECARIIADQGHEEPTGAAKITDAYNLPSKYVIHTVGPIANGQPTQLHREQLASSYTSCLNLAAEHHLKSIAFCCISTGAFGFPQVDAANIAVSTVRAWLDLNSKGAPNGASAEEMTVVFNVFSETDEKIYRELLGIVG